MFKRVGLFLLTNIAVMVVIGIVVRVLGADKFLSANGIDLPTLFLFSAIVGFSGSIISLLMSKQMAKMSVGAVVITNPSNQDEFWLVDTVARLSHKAGIKMPEVAIFEDMSPNAFATGAFKNDALVAVSRGLLGSMNQKEVEAVLGHEIGHVANGDMVTLTLLQGVVNTFVVFFARIIGYVVDRVILKNRNEGVGIGYMIASVAAEIVLGVLASMVVMAFSRYREYRADEAGANLSSTQNMIAALEALRRSNDEPHLPEAIKAFGINGKGFAALFSTHPSLEDRIEKLKNHHKG
ncbi:MAG: protease HtpX [Sulfurimonas sp.]|uniref:protease HtpX n=1 Tax=Sulfurimonas sp. TaxID=2022749 RepID=UPI00262A605A|nr:protease HtpX [Sulfurimonas sp.]MDD2653412.1 protease HtpX [Sulfurimonas sp.]MDD3452610.1 protease HtpX [Sulfurimonas sp.]